MWTIECPIVSVNIIIINCVDGVKFKLQILQMDASIAVLLLLANQPNQLRYPIAHLIRWRRMRTQFCDETCTEWHHPFKNWIAYPAACDANIVGCNFDGQIVRSAEQNTHFQYHLLTNSLFVVLFFFALRILQTEFVSLLVLQHAR